MSCTYSWLALRRFLTDDYNEEFYTEEGMKWIADANLSKVLLRAFPHVDELPDLLQNTDNAFFPWKMREVQLE